MSSEIAAERDQTDESLRVERQKSDQALDEKQSALEEDADEVVRHARALADAVVVAARATADERLKERESRVPTREELTAERMADDESLDSVRADADEALRLQRSENAAVLLSLLPLERQKTDRYLVTERARADDAVARRDDFLSIVSHDLRNLLSGIVLSAAALPESASETNGAKQRIQRYAARMNRLIGDLVDVASIDAGRLAIVPAHGDWSALIAEVTELFQPSASAHGIALETELHDSPLTAEFDHDRMMQVLANLIANSLKFTARGGKVLVQTHCAADELHCTVHDTGSGIPAHMLELIFERFWQARKDDQRGVGLGLYITRCIVEAHGGRIWAESIEGAGSTLHFTVPRSSSAAAVAPAVTPLQLGG